MAIFIANSGQPISPIFKARCLTLEDGPLGCPEIRQTNTNIGCITTPKSEHPIYTESEAYNNVNSEIIVSKSFWIVTILPRISVLLRMTSRQEIS